MLDGKLSLGLAGAMQNGLSCTEPCGFAGVASVGLKSFAYGISIVLYGLFVYMQVGIVTRKAGEARLLRSFLLKS